MEMVSLTTMKMFALMSLWVLVPAIFVVTLRNIFYAGLCLILSFMGVAGLYLLLRAEFLAVVQVLIYSGGIAVLIIFAVMMTERLTSGTKRAQNRLSFGAVVMALVFFALALFHVSGFKTNSMAPPAAPPTMLALSKMLLNNYALPFELVSVVLLAALIGALVISGKEERT